MINDYIFLKKIRKTFLPRKWVPLPFLWTICHEFPLPKRRYSKRGTHKSFLTIRCSTFIWYSFFFCFVFYTCWCLVEVPEEILISYLKNISKKGTAIIFFERSPSRFSYILVIYITLIIGFKTKRRPYTVQESQLLDT